MNVKVDKIDKKSDFIHFLQVHIAFLFLNLHLLNRIAQHGSGHNCCMFVQEFFNGQWVSFPSLAQHPADSLVHEVMWVMEQDFTQLQDVFQVIFPDEMQGGDNCYPVFPE